MNRRILALLLVALAMATPLMAQSFFIPKATPHMAPGNTAANAGISLGIPLGVGVGFESMIGKFDIPELFPLTYGVAAKGALGFGSSLHLAAGAFGTLHFSWNSMALPEFLQKLETYAGIGLGVGIMPTVNFGFAHFSGFAYHFSPSTAVYVEGVSFGGAGYGGNIGLKIKL